MADIFDIAVAKKLAGGDGGSAFVVAFTVDYETRTATTDKTYQEVETAIKTGAYVYGALAFGEDGIIILRPISYRENTAIYFCGFDGFGSDGSSFLEIDVTMDSGSQELYVDLYTIARTYVE